MRLRSTRLTAVAHAARIAVGGSPAWSPDTAWFSASEQGLWYDPTDLSTMYQDSAGTTPVTAVEQPVGRILDKSGRGNHATQATSTARPTLRNRYNLLTYSEQFDNAIWTKVTDTVTANTATAPNGTLTADTYTHTSGRIQISAACANRTVRLYVKPVSGSSSFVIDTAGAAGGDAVSFNLSAVTVTSLGANNTAATITSVGSGWLLLTVTRGTTAGSVLYFGLGAPASVTYIWGAQMVDAGDASLPYQRIAAATDYDSDASKFPLYLAFDGSDDWMSTGSVDFAGAPDLTLVAGMTRNAAGVSQTMIESSAVWSSNAGAFIVGVNGADGVSFGARGSGSITAAQVATGYTTGDKKVVAGTAALAADTISLRLNGAVVDNQTQDRGTGGLRNYPIFLGRRNGASASANFRLHQLLIRGAASADIAQAESFVAGKMGVTL